MLWSWCVSSSCWKKEILSFTRYKNQFQLRMRLYIRLRARVALGHHFCSAMSWRTTPVGGRAANLLLLFRWFFDLSFFEDLSFFGRMGRRIQHKTRQDDHRVTTKQNKRVRWDSSKDQKRLTTIDKGRRRWIWIRIILLQSGKKSRDKQNGKKNTTRSQWKIQVTASSQDKTKMPSNTRVLSNCSLEEKTSQDRDEAKQDKARQDKASQDKTRH